MAAGAHRVLKKPFDSTELLQTVELTMSAEKR
jgi:FixJ family two-component response regulator